MASDQQIKANQANAQLSHGPTSPEGKAKSSQNALKTGLYAKSRILRTENPEDYAELTANYYEQFTPASQDECFLVDRLITAEWLHRRSNATETAVWERRFDSMEVPALGGIFLNYSQVFTRIQNRIGANERSFDKARKELLAIQAKRAKEPVPQPFPHRIEAADDPAIPAAPEPNKSLNPDLDSFQPVAPVPPAPPPPAAETPSETPSANPYAPNRKEQPPIAA